MQPIRLAFTLALLLAATAASAQSTAPALPPVPVDRSTPQKALETYFRAMRAGNFKVLQESVVVTNASLARLAEQDMKYKAWQRYIEHAAIEKFGRDEGLKVYANVRPFQERLDLDIKRADNANVDVDQLDKTKATVYLKPDKNPLPEEKVASTYVMKQVNGVWKVDYLANTEELAKSDDTQSQKWLEALYPKVLPALARIAEQVKKGQFKSADDVKAACDQAWSDAAPAEKSPDQPTEKPATKE